jgi:arginyl-tRNA synthetase
MEENALAEVKQRHPDVTDANHRRIAHTLAAGALRYFLMKYTRTSVIAFDFDEALAFEGETGVYIQNAAVRIGSIFRKLAEANIKVDGVLDNVANDRLNELLSGGDGDDWWSLIYLASRLREITEQAVSTLEPAFVAKFAFQLAQRFNVFYQKYRIVSETDEAKRGLLITIASYVRTQLIAALGLLGIEVPEKM